LTHLNKMKPVLIILLVVFSLHMKAQQDTTKGSLTWSGYVDVYYAFDSGKPNDHVRPSFIYNYNRSNEVNLNLGFVKANYTASNVRANLALMAGTYAQYNYASEQGLLKNVLEANAGARLSKNKNLWIDAGIFSSHIGFESAISKDCWNLTRSVLADNTPYYLSGAKITYGSDNGKWTLAGLVINGWQRIQRETGNNTPAFGTQLIFKPNNNVTLNYSTFAGNTKPDSVKQMRYYNNFYGIIQVTRRLGVIAGFDYGIEQKSKNSSNYNLLYATALILRYGLTNKLFLAGRVEYYQDEHGIIIATNTPNGFKTSGFSVNLDYAPAANMLCRIEGRTLKSKDAIFTENGTAVNNNYSIVTSFAISF